MRFVRHHRIAPPTVAAPGEDEDPLAGIANLFDVSVAFIVALLIALFALFSSRHAARQELRGHDREVKTACGRLRPRSSPKKGAEIKVQKVTDKTLSGQGTRLGTAYRLANGQVVYVPEGEAPPSRP